MIYQMNCPSPVGPLTLASDGTHLLGLWMEGQKYFAATIRGAEVQEQSLPVFDQTMDWLARYFAGENPSLAPLPLAPAGSPFRQAVWKLLCEIPYGTVTTYGALAEKMAQRMHRPSMAAQAVGGAVGHNPLAILIPCHRVVGTNGSLTGYAGGVQKKQWLLAHEGADLQKLTIPTRGTAL